jgi:hypothetical protein
MSQETTLKDSEVSADWSMRTTRRRQRRQQSLAAQWQQRSQGLFGIDAGVSVHLDATALPENFVWGVKFQSLYPGGTLSAKSETADQWARAAGIPFYEVAIEGNAHKIVLIFSDLADARAADRKSLWAPAADSFR